MTRGGNAPGATLSGTDQLNSLRVATNNVCIAQSLPMIRNHVNKFHEISDISVPMILARIKLQTSFFKMLTVRLPGCINRHYLGH